MSLTDAIAAALKNSSDPVETLVDYLAEKVSRVTRAEAARLIRGFESQVGLLITGLQNDHPIPPDASLAVIEAAWFRAIRVGQTSLAEVLAAELQKRGAMRSTPIAEYLEMDTE